ncbi:GGDEF domain-containing response regulator [Singulisphaera sp. PoT]|uniref:GGDEF domain-containing response regulator n=1 Tax=Singulisphaera sp. PoT TaxID=3411797 RepID=UPI003BF5F858
MRILLAEDEVCSGSALRAVLEKQGHEVVLVTSGTEAWERICQEDWRLLISDWMMPGMDGIELCRRVRNRSEGPYTYIMLLTCRGDRTDRLEGMTAGADDFLAKPLDLEELSVRLEVARRILEVQAQLEQQNSQLARQATTDPLTGLANRTRLRDALESAAVLSTQQRVPCSVVITDVDNFKSFNDEFGHLAGDEVLKTVASLLRAFARRHDMVARFGGEEFVICLPGTDAHEASGIAERLRATFERYAWKHRKVTASFGVATLPPGLSNATVLLHQADQALYRSKRSGRNRVTHYQDLSSFPIVDELKPIDEEELDSNRNSIFSRLAGLLF